MLTRSSLARGRRLASADKASRSCSPAPFSPAAAGWRLRMCIWGHGEAFLSAERWLAVGLARTRLWSRCLRSRQPAVPAGGRVPERGEAFPDAGLAGALVALGGPAWPSRRVRGAGQRPGGLPGRAQRPVLLRLRPVHPYPPDAPGRPPDRPPP